jgi:hypothetical protein
VRDNPQRQMVPFEHGLCPRKLRGGSEGGAAPAEFLGAEDPAVFAADDDRRRAPAAQGTVGPGVHGLGLRRVVTRRVRLRASPGCWMLTNMLRPSGVTALEMKPARPIRPDRAPPRVAA